MTQVAYNKRKAEIDEMENVQMPAIAEKIAEARAEGDLKENAEYHAQRENQGHLHRKISELKSRLSRAEIVDPSKIPRDKVAFGATVKVLDVDLDDEEDITLVGDGDEDYDAGKYLITSPIGRGLLGKKVGDVAEIDVPKGTLTFKVLDITYNM
jgi:transcription elongation factor GreA